MDIKDLSEEQILELLSKGEKIPYYQNLSLNPESRPAIASFQDILNEEKKLTRALSRGISEQKGFHGSTKTKDIIKELSQDIGLKEAPDFEIAYKPGLGGWSHKDKPLIGLNPQLLSEFGKEAVIAHELRHQKEALPNFFSDRSIRTNLYTSLPDDANIIDALNRQIFIPEAIAKEEGKSLAYYNKLKERLFPLDKMKPSIDALDAYDFLERGHFAKSFLKENLERVAKGLPIIGTAATALGVATASNPAEAAIEEGVTGFVPGAAFAMGELGVSPEQADLDRRYLERVRQLSQRKK